MIDEATTQNAIAAAEELSNIAVALTTFLGSPAFVSLAKGNTELLIKAALVVEAFDTLAPAILAAGIRSSDGAIDMNALTTVLTEFGKPLVKTMEEV